VDAIRHAGLLLAELDRAQEEELVQRVHPLLGHASLHASTIEGGIGLSTYPDRCVLRLERRTVPGESAATAVEEVRAICGRLGQRRPSFDAEVRLLFAQGPSDVPSDAPIVRALAAALEVTGEAPRIEGMSAWTDAAILNDGGIPAICFGPGDIALAHAAAEWVPRAEIERATDVLAELARRWCKGEEWRN
jgi:acetylornithine deacetylase